jgi:GxxExxY protein
MFEPLPEDTERVGAKVLDGAFAVHRTLGPGLLESVYEACMCHELSKNNIPFQCQAALPVIYDGIRLEMGLRLDLYVSGQVIVEIKAVEKMIPLYEAQLLTYLKLRGARLGFLINFNSPLLRDGIKRLVL